MGCNGGAGNPGGLDDPTLSLSGTKNGYDYLVMGTDTEIGTLDVTRTQLTFTAYKSETGEIFDVFNLTKPPLQRDVFVMCSPIRCTCWQAVTRTREDLLSFPWGSDNALQVRLSISSGGMLRGFPHRSPLFFSVDDVLQMTLSTPVRRVE